MKAHCPLQWTQRTMCKDLWSVMPLETCYILQSCKAVAVLSFLASGIPKEKRKCVRQRVWRFTKVILYEINTVKVIHCQYKRTTAWHILVNKNSHDSLSPTHSHALAATCPLQWTWDSQWNPPSTDTQAYKRSAKYLSISKEQISVRTC